MLAPGKVRKVAITDARRDAAASALSRPVKRLLIPIFAVVLGFCAVCAHVLIEARQATWERAAEIAASLAAAIESDISRNIETLDLSLQGVVDNLNYPDLDKLDPELRKLVLFDRSATARHMGAIITIDKFGDISLDSRAGDTSRVNLADRDYFQVHKDSDSAGLYISKPMISRASGQWFIGLSRRLSNADGSFAGVVMASLRLSYFQQLFKDASLGANSNITLSRNDGMVLMRWPYKEEFIGMNISHAALFEHLTRSRAGRFETYAATDGLHRLIVYTQIGNLPLAIGVGQSTDDIYARWRQYAVVIGLMIAALCAMTVFLALYLTSELKRRRDAEANLAVLAMTDGLTASSNRRHFNETLDREWRRAMRAKAPVTLIMLDADLFKSYNDVHGHQAGDKLLQTISAAITGTIRRGTDFGARYGGDEFAILLPGAPLCDAERIAEKIRYRFTALCQHDQVAPSGLSIGVASVTPEVDEHYSELVGRADIALYRAKDLGRNRTETASEHHIEPVKNVAAKRHQAA